MVGSVFVCSLVWDRLAGLHSLDSRRRCRTPSTPRLRARAQVSDLMAAVRVVVVVGAACATAMVILGYQVLQRSRGARIGPRVLAVPLFVSGLVTGGYVAAIVGAAARPSGCDRPGCGSTASRPTAARRSTRPAAPDAGPPTDAAAGQQPTAARPAAGAPSLRRTSPVAACAATRRASSSGARRRSGRRRPTRRTPRGRASPVGRRRRRPARQRPRPRLARRLRRDLGRHRAHRCSRCSARWRCSSPTGLRPREHAPAEPAPRRPGHDRPRDPGDAFVMCGLFVLWASPPWWSPPLLPRPALGAGTPCVISAAALAAFSCWARSRRC